MINMQEQFIRLTNIIDTVETFYFGMTNQYLGPIDPTAIISFGSNIVNIHVLILAERVPSFYLPTPSESDHHEAVMVYLDEKYEFRYYSPTEKELKGLSVLVGDPLYDYDGSIENAKGFFAEKNWSFDILYKNNLM